MANYRRSPHIYSKDHQVPQEDVHLRPPPTKKKNQGYSGDYADLHHDLWSFDPSSSNTSAWRSPMVRRDLPQPSGRAYHAAAWVPETESLWIHGGYDGSRFGRVKGHGSWEGSVDV